MWLKTSLRLDIRVHQMRLHVLRRLRIQNVAQITKLLEKSFIAYGSDINQKRRTRNDALEREPTR